MATTCAIRVWTRKKPPPNFLETYNKRACILESNITHLQFQPMLILKLDKIVSLFLGISTTCTN